MQGTRLLYVPLYSCGNATLTQETKGRNDEEGERVLQAAVPASEIASPELRRNTFIAAN